MSMESSAHKLDPHRWQALTVVCVAFFMTVLDVSIVNVALPSIKTSLHVSESNLQWVLIAYTITFGGLLLLGGRAAEMIAAPIPCTARAATSTPIEPASPHAQCK